MGSCRAQNRQNVVVKSVDNARLRNERNVLRRFQGKSNFIRPLLDEIEDHSAPAIVLTHLDDNIHHASVNKRLSRQEVKHVARKVLEALSVLHEEGFVHTGMELLTVYCPTMLIKSLADIEPRNVLVNYGRDNSDRPFPKVLLASFGSAVHADSGHARKGAPIGTPAFRSPEAHLSIRWGPATDIWSFGAMVGSVVETRAAPF